MLLKSMTVALAVLSTLVSADSEEFGMVIIRSTAPLHNSAVGVSDGHFVGGKGTDATVVITDDGKLKLVSGSSGYADIDFDTDNDKDDNDDDDNDNDDNDRDVIVVQSVPTSNVCWSIKNGYLTYGSDSAFSFDDDSELQAKQGNDLTYSLAASTSSGSRAKDFTPSCASSGSASSAASSVATLVSSGASKTTTLASTSNKSSAATTPTTTSDSDDENDQSGEFGLVIIRSTAPLHNGAIGVENGILYGNKGTHPTIVITSDGRMELSTGGFAVVESDDDKEVTAGQTGSTCWSISNGYLEFNGNSAFSFDDDYKLQAKAGDNDNDNDNDVDDLTYALTPLFSNGTKVPDFTPKNCGSNSNNNNNNNNSGSVSTTVKSITPDPTTMVITTTDCDDDSSCVVVTTTSVSTPPATQTTITSQITSAKTSNKATVSDSSTGTSADFQTAVNGAILGLSQLSFSVMFASVIALIL